MLTKLLNMMGLYTKRQYEYYSKGTSNPYYELIMNGIMVLKEERENDKETIHVLEAALSDAEETIKLYNKS